MSELSKIKLKDETGNNFNPFYSMELIDENGQEELLATIDTYIRSGSNIFKINLNRFGFLGTDLGNDLAKNKKKMGLLLDFLSSKDFEKSIKQIIEKRKMTAAESQLLYQLSKKEDGKKLSCIELKFDTMPSPIPFVVGMNFDEFSQYVEMIDALQEEMRKQTLSIGERIAREKSQGTQPE